MIQYKLIKQEQTHISGSVLDHVYISEQALEKLLLETIQKVNEYIQTMKQ